MQQLVARYLDHRRQLGYELVSTGILLRSFARFADRTALGQPLTTDLGYRWALAPAPLTPRYRQARLGALRGLSRYAALFDPRTEAMPKAQFGSSARHRPTPHIYTLAQVRMLMRDAALLEPSWSPLRALTMRTVIGLLSSKRSGRITNIAPPSRGCSSAKLCPPSGRTLHQRWATESCPLSSKRSKEPMS